MMSWDYLLGLTTEFTECSEVEKRGGDENQSFEMIGNASFPFVSSVFSESFDSLRSLLRSCLRQSISKAPPFRLWLNFLVGCGLVFEEAFLTE